MPLQEQGIPRSEKGAANGVAELDATGKVPAAELPTLGGNFVGEWDANTNTPTLSDATGTVGHLYAVSVAGSQDLGSGSISFAVGDEVRYDDTNTRWVKIPIGTTPTSANPATQVGLTPVNGVAATYMRSDAAPALSQAIAPTWTGQHTWTEPLLVNSGGVQTSWTPGGSVLQIGTVTSHNLNIATNNVTRMTVAANGDVQMAAGYTPANPRSIVTKEYSDAQDALKVNTADKASEAEAEAGTDDTKWMTPLKTAQAINVLAHGGDDTTVYVLSSDQVFSDTNLTGVTEFSQIILADNLNQVRLIEAELYISGAHEAGIKFKFQNAIGDGTTISYNGSAQVPEGITGDDPLQVADYDGTVGGDGVRYDPIDTIRKVTLSLYVTSQAFGGSYGSLLFGAALQNMADPVTIHAGSKVTVRLVSSTS